MKLIRTQVIVNPESNQGRTRYRWKDIKEAIHSFIHEFRYEFTEKPLQAIEITREAIRSGHELIIGVGGDGTMHEIANGRIFGKGIKFAPHAALNDGQFDFILVKGMGFLEFCLQGWKVFFGMHLSHPKISFTRGRDIEAFSPEEQDVTLELDGEQLGGLPARFEILPKHLLVKGYI